MSDKTPHPADEAIDATLDELQAEAVKRIRSGDCHTESADYGHSRGRGIMLRTKHGDYAVTIQLTLLAQVRRKDLEEENTEPRRVGSHEEESE